MPETKKAFKASDFTPSESAPGSSRSVRDIRGTGTDRSGPAAQQEVAPSPPKKKGDSFLARELKDINAVMNPMSATGAAVEGAKSGAITGTGALAGFRAGVALPVPGPAKVVAGIAGSVIGGYGSEKLKDTFGLATPVEDVPEEMRPYYNAAETFSSSVMMVATPYTLRSHMFGKGRVGGWIDDVVNSAIKYKTTYVLAETAGASGAATGAFLAETMDAGDATTRMIGEVIGGVVSPTRAITAGYRRTLEFLTKPARRFTEGGQQDEAVKVLNGLFEAYGEDPEKVIHLINNGALDGLSVPLTTAQQTGSRSLIDLTNALAKQDSSFRALVDQRGTEATGALDKMLTAFESSGDPLLVQAAAEAKQAAIRDMLDESVKLAQEEAARISFKIVEERGSDSIDLSRQAYEVVAKALESSRKVESSLYDAVPIIENVKASNLSAFYNAAKDDLFVGAKLPTPQDTDIGALIRSLDSAPTGELPSTPEGVAEYLAGVKAAPADAKPLTSKQLVEFRSRMLAAARTADRAGDSKTAGFYSKLGQAALEDLNIAFGDANPAYNAARDFSRNLNEAYSENFAGRMQASGKYGDVIQPELTLTRAFQSDLSAARTNLTSLDEAVQFAIDNANLNPDSMDKMFDMQERFMRLTTAKLFEPDGTLKTGARLVDFKKNNQPLLDKFPNLDKQIQDAIDGKGDLDQVMAIFKVAAPTNEKRALYTRLTKEFNEKPSSAIRKFLTSPTRDADLTEVFDIVKNSEEFNTPEGMAALRTAVWEGIVEANIKTGAGEKQAKLKFKNMATQLFDAPGKGQTSLADLLISQGVMSKEQLAQAKKLFKAVETIEAAAVKGTEASDLGMVISPLTDFVTRMVGANLATNLAKMSGSNVNSIIIGSAGSKLSQTFWNRVPGEKLNTVLIQAMTDPAFAAMLMKRTKTETERIQNFRQMHAYLMSAGIIGIGEGIDQQMNQGEQQ